MFGRGSRQARLRGCCIAVVTVGIALLAPGAAQAATCELDTTSAKLKVTDSTGASVVIKPDGTEIDIYSPSPITCAGGTPTMTNVDKVVVTDQSDFPGSAEVAIEDPASFAPGFSPAGDAGPDNADEIEFKIKMDSGGKDILSYSFDDNLSAAMRYGTRGVNHNVGSPGVIEDVDVTFTGVESFVFFGTNAADTVSGAGGKATGGPTPLPFLLPGANYAFEGQGGADRLTGGAGDDRMGGNAGADRLRGGGGKDVVDAVDAAADELIDCGGAKDRARVDEADPVAKHCERVDTP